MKRAEVMHHGVLRECTLVLQRRRRMPPLPWEKDRAGAGPSILTAKIGGVELEDGSEYLVICEDKGYTVQIEMALGLSNRGCVVAEWPYSTPASAAGSRRQLQCW